MTVGDVVRMGMDVDGRVVRLLRLWGRGVWGRGRLRMQAGKGHWLNGSLRWRFGWLLCFGSWAGKVKVVRIVAVDVMH